MDQVVFVPVSDELLFDHPERIRGRLVPYTPGMNISTDRDNAAGQSAAHEKSANPAAASGPVRRARR